MAGRANVNGEGDARRSLISFLSLLGRARTATVGAKHAAVARLGSQQFAAARALIEELAGIGRHSLNLGSATVWASDGREQFAVRHTYSRDRAARSPL